MQLTRLALLPLSVLVLAMLGYAMAQEVAPNIPHDPRLWVLSTASLAGVVAGFTAFLKERLNLHGVLTLVASFACGIGIALAATVNLPWFGRLLPADMGVLDAITFGASASVLASGGWDVVKGLLLAHAKARLGNY